MTNEVQEFIDKLQPKDIGEEQIGNYIVAYEGFTDNCFDYLIENGLTIEETENMIQDTWNGYFGTPIESGWRTEIVTYTEPNILYSIYKVNKQASSQLTPESITKLYNFNVEYTDESSGGYWVVPDTIYVSTNTEPMNYFAANWTKNDASDFYSNNSYPENVVTAAHEIAHGLFSRNPSKGHEALNSIIELGVPREVALESLVDLGGLYLLEPDAITDENLNSIVDIWLKDQRKADKQSNKELWEMTKEEYEEYINYLNSNRVNEELRIPMSHGRNISVYKNPTYIDMWKMEERFKEEFPRASKGEIVSRMTIDDEGNVYRWYANDAAHFQVESTLKDRYGINANQNNELRIYKTVLKDAIKEDKNVPIENLQNYPDLLVIVQEKQANSQPIEIIEDLDTTRNSLKSLDKISYKMEDILNEDLNNELTKKKEDIIAFMKDREQWEQGLHTSRTMLCETFRQDPNSTKNEIRWRIRNPKDFKQDTFRRWNTWAGVKAPKGIQFLVGELKDSNKKALQTIRFNKDIYDEKEASIYWNRIKDKSGFNKTWTQEDWDKEKIAMTTGESKERGILDTQGMTGGTIVEQSGKLFLNMDALSNRHSDTTLSDETRNALLNVRGKYSNVNTSSDKFTQSKQADTTLFNNPWITIKQDNKGYTYASVPEGVAILPYKTEDDKTLYMLRSEQNSVLAPEGSLITVITGRRDDEDKEEQWYIQCAIRELEEEAGIVATEDKITLLGEMSTNKHTKQSDMLLAIDVTGLEENEPETDGTDDEAQSYNFWVDEKGLKDFIRTSKDSYLSTITNKFFNKDVNMSIVSMGRS